MDDFMMGQVRTTDKIFPKYPGKGFYKPSERIYGEFALDWPYKAMLNIKSDSGDMRSHHFQALHFHWEFRVNPSLWVNYLCAFGFRASRYEAGVQIHLPSKHAETGERDIRICYIYSATSVKGFVKEFYPPLPLGG